MRFRGPYAYVDAVPPGPPAAGAPGQEERPIRLCRLGYLAGAASWAFAFYRYSDERYEPSVGFSGSFETTPEEAFDCAAGVYLAY